MVETALILPLLVLLAVVTVDLGRAFYYQEAIANVTREGARWGATHKDATASDIEAAALAEAGALGSSVTISEVIQADEAVSGKYIKVTATYDFQLVTPFVQGFFSDSSIELTSTSKMPAATTFSN